MTIVRMKTNCQPQAPTPVNSSRVPATSTTSAPLTEGPMPRKTTDDSTRPAGGEHVRVEAVPPAVAAPSAAPPLAADAAVPRAAVLRAAASDSIAPRADYAVAQRPPEVIPGGPAAPVRRTEQPGVPALRAERPDVLAAQVVPTAQAPTRAAVPARVVQGHGVAIAIVPDPQKGPVAVEQLQIQQPAPAVPSAARSATANPALPATHASAGPNAAAHRVVVPAKAMARAVRRAQSVMRAIRDAAAA